MGDWQYCFKEYGWSYEREVRLVLVFEDDFADHFKRIAVTFDKPLAMVAKNFPQYVMHGPWFGNSAIPRTKAAGHSLSEATPSRYNELVKMRSVCDVCPQQNKKDCICPFRGQR